MKQPKLTVQKRELSGKKVKQLRKEGILPANLYGNKIASQSLQVNTETFKPLYDEVGNTGLIDLTVEGSKKTHPVLIHNVQMHPVTDELLHADFHQVSLTEKMHAEIPVTLKGESPAHEKNTGVLLQVLDTIEVNALPADLPEEIVVDISSLKEVDDEIKVSDLKAGQKYEIVTDPTQIIVKINPLQKEEEVAPAAPAKGEAVEGAEAPAEGQAPEGEKPAGEEQKQEGQKEQSTQPQDTKPAEEKKE